MMERDPIVEKLKYQDNKISYNLALLAFLVNQYYLIIVMNNVKVDYNVGIEIFINLIFYMFLFLGMEKVKLHHLSWSKFFLVIGGFFFLRIAYIPMIIRAEAKELTLLGDDLSLQVAEVLEKATMNSIVALIVCGVLIIISGLYGMRLSLKLKNYYEQLESN